MNRLFSNLGLGLLGTLMVVSLFYVMSITFLSWLLLSPAPESVLASAQPGCEPILQALTKFHQRHGHYPEDLKGLVTENLLGEIPVLPTHWGTSSRSGPTYEVNPSLDFYRLSYSYVVEEGIGPGDRFTRFFVSDDPQGWSSEHLEPFDDLVANRLLAFYRKQHDEATLERFMSEVIKKANCDHLSRRRVSEWLGEGETIILPSGVGNRIRKGSVYQSNDDLNRRYCFVYKDQWLSIPKAYLSNEEKARYTKDKESVDSGFVKKNYPILDKLFLIQKNDGRPVWSLIHECPASSRNKPIGQ